MVYGNTRTKDQFKETPGLYKMNIKDTKSKNITHEIPGLLCYITVYKVNVNFL